MNPVEVIPRPHLLSTACIYRHGKKKVYLVRFYMSGNIYVFKSGYNLR